MIKRYFDTDHGQVHGRLLPAVNAASQPTLVLLHPAPASGLYFANVMPLLNTHRDVLALDYPGYGGSDAIEGPTISDYAQAMLDATRDISGPFDVLGFHTGCLVAAEMTHTSADRINRVLMIDVPYFTGEKQAQLKQQMSQPLGVSSELECLAKAWKFDVENRLSDVPIDRAFELFVEHLRSGTADALGFNAAFSYDCDARLTALAHKVTILATRSGLLEPSHQAAAQLPHCELIDVMDVDKLVFEAGAENIAVHINRALGPSD